MKKLIVPIFEDISEELPYRQVYKIQFSEDSVDLFKEIIKEGAKIVLGKTKEVEFEEDHNN